MIKLIAFTTAFLIGVLMTFGAEGPFYEKHDCAPGPEIRKQAERITVEYDGWEFDSDARPRIRISITNGLSNTISYFAHSREDPFAQVTRNGDRIFLFHCGTGASDHFLFPGDSLTASVSRFDLGAEPMESADEFTISYYFKIGNMENAVLVTSEPFQLPADLRSALDDETRKARE